MENNEDVSNLKLAKNFRFHSTSNVEAGIAHLIEAAELLRRNKIVTDASYSEVFFSAAKHYIG